MLFSSCGISNTVHILRKAQLAMWFDYSQLRSSSLDHQPLFGGAFTLADEDCSFALSVRWSDVRSRQPRAPTIDGNGNELVDLSTMQSSVVSVATRARAFLLFFVSSVAAVFRSSADVESCPESSSCRARRLVCHSLSQTAISGQSRERVASCASRRSLSLSSPQKSACGVLQTQAPRERTQPPARPSLTHAFTVNALLYSSVSYE